MIVLSKIKQVNNKQQERVYTMKVQAVPFLVGCYGYGFFVGSYDFGIAASVVFFVLVMTGQVDLF